jgi:hypothetical protein
MNDSQPISAIRAPLPFYYVIVVWGQEYVDMFLDIALPCYLSPGNLPALSNLKESRFLILTTPQDAERISRSPIYKLLSNVITTVFVDSPWIDYDLPYHLKAARGHRAAAEIAAQNEGYCVYLAPDFVVSDGSLQHLEQVARQGFEAVMIPGLRLVKEAFLEDLKRRYPVQPGIPIQISSRSLVDIALDHIHDENQRFNWGHPYFSDTPVVCTWKVPGEKGLLIRAFHLHPILVSMRGQKSLSPLDTDTIDGNFLGHNVPDWDRILVEPDSDKLVMFSLTKKLDRRDPLLIPNQATPEKLSVLAFGPGVNPLHRHFFTKAIKLHSNDLNSHWTEIEKQTGLLVYQILGYGSTNAFAQLNAVPVAKIIPHLLGRINRRLPRVFFAFIQTILHPSRLFKPRTEPHTFVEVSVRLYDVLVAIRRLTGRESLNDVMVDAVKHYQSTLECAQQQNKEVLDEKIDEQKKDFH